MNDKFKNPYLGVLKDGTSKKLNANIHRDDYNFIQGLSTTEGRIQTIMSLLWQKLTYECKRRNITDLTKQDDFERFVVDCELTLPGERGSGGGIMSQTNESNVRGRVKGVRKRTA